MDELQIVNLEQTEITSWDFDQINEELAKALSVYKGIVYTDESIKSAKEDKATLNKAKKLVEDQRKEYKAKCLAPYGALEPKVKELVAMIEEQRVLIDDVVKDYTERQKQEKEAEVKKYYDKKAFVLGNLAEDLYPKLLDQKWLNASMSKAKYEEGVQMAINNALNDINTIKAMESPFVDTLLEKYVATLSVEDAKAIHQELMDSVNKAGLTRQAAPVEPVPAQPKVEVKSNSEEGVSLNVYASQNQMNQICDFMKAIGVTYKIQ